MPTTRAKDLLPSLYDAALAAAAPAAAVHQAFAANEVTVELGRDRQHWILSVGKAAAEMGAAAVAACERRGLHVAGGLIVAASEAAAEIAPAAPVG